jgi:predicted metal-dependent HD superfamily phosphohydrolase
MPALITWWTRDVLSAAPYSLDEAVVARAGTGLLARWSEPDRRYHTTRHLVEMFAALEELEGAGEIDDRECSIARLAAWFHDAIHDPRDRSGSNEASSATLARDTLPLLGVGDDDVETIDRLIRLTVRHDTDTGLRLDAAFHDADLWILSAPQERFDDYCEQVREEYAHLPDAAYRQGRAAILGPFSHRETIYRTSHSVSAWETAARINLGRELARLGLDL